MSRWLVLLVSLCAMAGEPVALQVEEVAPVRFEKRGAVYFADFGKNAYGNLRITFGADPGAGDVRVRLGEKLGRDGGIERKPEGSVNFREVALRLEPGKRTYQLVIPPKPFHTRGDSVQMPASIGEVTVFRYAEIEGAPAELQASGMRQLFVHAPFNDNAASFRCSDETLNAVWDLCKYTMKATTAFGVYIDGERERIPYEADAYLNQLSHYACDLDPRVARYSIEYLLQHPTWPIEWSLHTPMMAAADYIATGDLQVARQHYEKLKSKLLMEKAREDGLLRAWAIVDWPVGERDGYNEGQISPADRRMIGPEVNTVVNAFYFHALRQMAMLARGLKKSEDAGEFERKAAQVQASFQRVFFDRERGVYVDGEGSKHASLHANMFPLAFGLVPEAQQNKVADFVESRGMACSVYGAQYLLEGLFAAGKAGYAVQLMSARTKRSWWHMIELGSTTTLEAWDVEYKRNLTWNHAWGAVPANIVARFVLGVRPLEPGYRKMLIQPQLGGLRWAEGKVPTALGPVEVSVKNEARYEVTLDLPRGADARVEVPKRARGEVLVDGRNVRTTASGLMLQVEGIRWGRHRIESR